MPRRFVEDILDSTINATRQAPRIVATDPRLLSQLARMIAKYALQCGVWVCGKFAGCARYNLEAQDIPDLAR
jgi:hypothetical protein